MRAVHKGDLAAPLGAAKAAASQLDRVAARAAQRPGPLMARLVKVNDEFAAVVAELEKIEAELRAQPRAAAVQCYRCCQSIPRAQFQAHVEAAHLPGSLLQADDPAALHYSLAAVRRLCFFYSSFQCMSASCQ